MSSSDMTNTAASKLRVDVWMIQDPGAEVFLLDGRLEVAARGVGGLHVEQPPGVYKLKIKTGETIKEELVVLQDKPYSKSFESLSFPSAAPLAETSRTHEYHMQGAYDESAKTHVFVGQGSKLFMFARDWTPKEIPSDSQHNPAEGLVLRGTDGATLVDFETQSVRRFDEDPYAACSVALNPGAYRLGVTLASGETFEQTVALAPGWRTDVFLLQREGFGERSGKRPDLAGAAISMSKAEHFNASDSEGRLTEVARMAVVNRRPILSGDLGVLLHGKYENPMLGIFGGHLILMTINPDLELLNEVIRNLRGLLREPHPDVESLALAAGLDPTCDFGVPPMLRRSWQLVVEGSGKRAGLTPSGTLASRIATRITNQDPWLIWQKPSQDVEDEELDFSEAIVKLLKPGAIGPGETRPVLQTLSQVYVKAMALAERYVPSFRSRAQAKIDVAFRTLMSETTMLQLVQTLGVPRANVEEMLITVHKRLSKG
jgi:hypothetical protein